MWEDEIFQEIRKMGVTLWIGSGFSYYAGYISGNELRDLFIQLLSPEAQNSYSSKSLQEIAQIVEDSVDEGRQKILNILKREFVDKVPSTTRYHEILAKIPHFNSIITTNYDRLLETTYGTTARCIIDDSELHSHEIFNTNIYKVHGDLSKPKSIIISTKDYIEAISHPDSNIISVVKSQIATKTMLFIGYDLNDININRIFEQVWSNVGHLSIPAYLVAPNLSSYRISSLLKNNIRYIDSKGEPFIEKVYKMLGKYILQDHENGFIGPNILMRHLANEKIFPELSVTDDRYTVTSIKGINGNVEGSGALQLSASTEFINQFSDFLKGRNGYSFVIPNDIVENFAMNVGDITLLNASNVALKLESVPAYEGTIDIRFAELGQEFRKYRFSVYKTENHIKIRVDMKCGELVAESLNSDYSSGLHVKLNGRHLDKVGKTSDEIEYFQFVYALLSGSEYVIEINGSYLKNKLSKVSNDIDLIKQYLKYFEKLREIENHFSIRFNDYLFKDISEETDMITDHIVDAINNEEIEQAINKPIYATLEESADLNELSKFDGTKGLTAIQQHITEYTLHNEIISLGYKKVRFPNLLLKNYRNLQKRKTDKAKFISQTGKCYVSYLQNLE